MSIVVSVSIPVIRGQNPKHLLTPSRGANGKYGGSRMLWWFEENLAARLGAPKYPNAPVPPQNSRFPLQTKQKFPSARVPPWSSASERSKRRCHTHERPVPNISRKDARLLSTGLVQQWAQWEGSCLASAAPFAVGLSILTGKIALLWFAAQHKNGN
jgi:hypothetical protein